tara:strand:+ start:48 stop:1034 length:987 start_codon:yes stop_codon:yes gene_type:complete
MATETPMGTLQARDAIVNLLSPQEQIEENNPPVEEETLQEEEALQPEEDSTEYESEDESPDYNEEIEKTRTFKIKVKGQEKEVTEPELIKLASMGEDYTQKTQAIAEQRKILESITQETEAARARMSQLLPELEDSFLQIEKKLNAEPDWDALAKQDPAKTQILMREFDKERAKNKAELEKVRAEKQRLLAEDQQRALQQRQDLLVQQGQLLLENVPEWQDSNRATKEKEEIERWALSNGYLDQGQLNNIVDWGSVAIMRKAWLYDQGKSAVAKTKAKSKSKTLSPGSTGSAPKRDTLKSQREAFMKSRKSSDARELVAGILNQSQRR